MKTSFKGQILSAVVFAVAIAGAVSSNAMNRSDKGTKNVAVVKGWERINGSPTNCMEHTDCSTIDSGTICTFPDNGARLWGKTSASSPCNVPLYKLEQ